LYYSLQASDVSFWFTNVEPYRILYVCLQFSSHFVHIHVEMRVRQQRKFWTEKESVS